MIRSLTASRRQRLRRVLTGKLGEKATKTSFPLQQQRILSWCHHIEYESGGGSLTGCSRQSFSTSTQSPDKDTSTSVLTDADAARDHPSVDQLLASLSFALSSKERGLQSVEASFHALEQLIQKQLVQKFSPPIVNSDLVAKVLIHWKDWLFKHPSVGTSSEVVTKLWYYQKQLPNNVSLWNTRSYTTILEGFLLESQRCGRGSPPAREKALQAQSFVEYILDNKTFAPPTGKHFQLLLEVHLQAGDLLAAKSVLEFVLRNGQGQRIYTVAFQHLLQACVEFPMPYNQHRGHMADAFLHLLMEFAQRDNLLIGVPQTEHFTQAITAWANSQDPQSGHRALQIWNWIAHLQPHTKSNRHPLAPDAVLMGAVLNALARQGQAQEAEALLKQVMASSSSRFLPDLHGFNSVLHAWSQSQDPNAGERATRFLRAMQSSDWNVKPDVVSYTSVIHAWGKSSALLSGNGHNNTVAHRRAVQRGNQLFQEMLLQAETNPAMEPNTVTYSALLNCYAKAGDVPRAAQLLGVMCTNYASGLSVKAEPNELCFATVLDAMARSHQPESGVAAEELLRKMEGSGIKPGTQTYNIVMNCWVQSGSAKAGEKTERLLREMQDKVAQGNSKRAAPKRDTYNVVINAWNRSGSVEDAERLLKEIQEIGRRPGWAHMKPDRMAYHAVMNGHVRAGNPERVEELLAEMIQQGDGPSKPDEETYRLCLNAWAVSGRPESGERADFYLQQMEEEFPNPKFHRLEMRYKLAIDAWLGAKQHNKLIATPRLQQLFEHLKRIQGSRKQSH